MSATTNLYAAQKNDILEITSVPKIDLLENIGLRSGTRLFIQNRYACGGPLLLRVEEAYNVALGKDIAIQIGVEHAGVS
ncbi:MAG: ferrous iron transport protein A [Lachnospiraceae bacterium]|nr:ferrous iron transport protein A [Lachnospiraceae bacterium]